MSVEEIKYFLSYTRQDSAFVLKLATELREAGVNGVRSGYVCFFPKRHKRL